MASAASTGFRREAEPEQIDSWMQWRQADVDRRDDDEGAGRLISDAGAEGRYPTAARPLDVVSLGKDGSYLRSTKPRSSADRAYLGDEFEPTDATPSSRRVKSRPGDSISKLMGTSDPRAVGRFMAVNGLRSSTLRAGSTYQLPEDWDDAGDSELRVGAATLRADNRRLRERAERQALSDLQLERFNGGQNIWTGLPREGPPPPGASRSVTLRKRSWVDDNVALKRAAGVTANVVGLAPGVLRGGMHAIDGAVDTAVLVGRLVNPLGGSDTTTAWGELEDLGKSGAGYASSRWRDPSLLKRDVESSVKGFTDKHVLGATPMADTLMGEWGRGLDVGLNDGELLFNAASLLGGGVLAKGASRLGAAAKAADAVELAYLAKNPKLAAYLAEPYTGPMGHHIFARRNDLPSWLGGGKPPSWFMEGPFNKIREGGMTNRDFFRNHHGVDNYYWGGGVPKRYGGGGWSAKRLGWDRYQGLDRLWYGSAPATKASLGAVSVGTLVENTAPQEELGGWR